MVVTIKDPYIVLINKVISVDTRDEVKNFYVEIYVIGVLVKAVRDR